MPDFTWICHSCKESNSPGTQVCRNCGFPAAATAAEIEEFATGIKRRSRRGRKEILKARREEIAVLPSWKKPFAYVLRTIQFVSAVIFWIYVFTLSLQGVALSVAVAIVAELLFQLLKGNRTSERNQRGGL